MDPFLEAFWHDVHTRLLTQLSDQIAKQLPDDLVVSIEQGITLGEEVDPKAMRSDVDVSAWGNPTNWKEDWNPEYETYDPGNSEVLITEPIVASDLDLPHRFLEIRSIRTGKPLITIIEILSPGNKLGGKSGQEYRAKREHYLQSPINFVEVDLLRQGGIPFVHFSDDPSQLKTYHIYTRRFGKAVEIIPIHLLDRLPRFRIPLRPPDLPAVVDLQAAIDNAYQRGQYWKRIDYREDKLSQRPEEDLAAFLSSQA